jgi:hypothetical protein
MPGHGGNRIKTQQYFHSLTQNTIKNKAFEFRAQAIFNLLEKTPPPLWVTQFEVFFIILKGTQGIIYIGYI